MLRFGLLFLIGTLGFSIAAKAEIDPPPGWRLPTKDDLNDELQIRKESPSGFTRAVADFNGDGIDDTAYLLKPTTHGGEGLWVHLSDGPNNFKWINLDKSKWDKKYSNVGFAMGIEVVPPGIHPYACFDDSKDECNFGHDKDRPKLKLSDPSLMYFKLESAASMFFWSRKHKRFLRVWLSD
jgi:hypothetical protein